MGKRFRELFFDARSTGNGGGVSLSDETILFNTDHNLANGQAIVYNKNGNPELSTGPYKGLNTDNNTNLESGTVYFAKSINARTVELYPSFNDYNAGINTVGFTTISNVGNHKFRVFTHSS